MSSPTDKPFKVSEQRERELLGEHSPEEFSESSEVYKKKIQEESLEGLPDYLRILCIAGDYLGITSPEKRLAARIRKSDQSCIKQRVLIVQYEKKIRQQEQLVAEKEAELRDCALFFERKKADIEQAVLRAERLEEEKQEQEEKLRRNPADQSVSDEIIRIDSELIQANQDLRRYQREKNEFAARVIENESFIKEAQNAMVSVQIYSSALHKNYLRSRIERMRLAPLIGMGKNPLETIDVIVKDQKIAEETGRLADAMTLWVGELTEQISEMRIVPRERNNMYSDLSKRYDSSNQDINSIAEKIIAAQRKKKYT
jgi:hypothetical protein